ncbi:MAG: MarC family NAAT transporter [Rhodocyclales bacterium]|nr:MarC family NAAT transporter [Rhodocyclales bacterium]
MEPTLYKLATSFLLGGLVSLVTITNPLSKIPLFVSLAADLDEAAARREASRACIYALALLAGCLFAGVAVLETFGISYGALRVAGGLTVAVIGYRMLFGTTEALFPRPTSSGTATGFAFFPLAMPGIAGPGAIATVIGISTEIAELPSGALRATAYGATVFSILATCLLMFGIFRSARLVSRWLGGEGINVVARLTGFLLVCIGVQFVGSGIRSFVAGT